MQRGSKNGISRRYGNNMHNKWALYSESIKGLYKNLHYIISHDNKMKLITIIIHSQKGNNCPSLDTKGMMVTWTVTAEYYLNKY